ncbi:MAG: ATP-binding protein [Terrimicrobiaceae bacterium]|nr:ATP-binding protein [Terrimicrobiaceae bacterium]
MTAGQLPRTGKFPRLATWCDGLWVGSLVFATLAIVGSLTTLLGWALRIPALTDWTGRGISTFPNTGVAGACCGLALILLGGNPTGWRLLAGRLLAVFATVVGLLTLFQHLTGVNLGIDELLFRGEWGQRGTVAPMRIGVPASVSFTILGTAIVLTTLGSRPRRAAAALGLATIGIASLSLVGYLFGANQLFGIARFTAIAWPTAIIVAALSAGLIARVPEWGVASLLCRPDAGGVVARGLLLPIIAVPLFIGWIRVAGESVGFFDPTFGAALRTLVEMGLLLGFLWWTATSIGRHDSAEKAAADALRVTEARFASFLQALPGPAWIKDTDGRFVFGNQAAERVFQVPPKSLVGRTYESVLPPETAKRCAESDRAAVEIGCGLQTIETLATPQGGTSFWLVHKFPIPHANGRPAWVGGVAIDITERMEAEAALREAHRRKDEFLATLAHELRNPLAPIRYAVEIFKLPTRNEDDYRTASEIVARQVHQMARLLDDLLDVSRISHGKLTLRPEPVALSKVLASAVETSRPAVDHAGQRLTIHLPDQEIWLDADPVRLAQVLSNLLNNASKFSAKDTEICVDVRATAEEVSIAVRDQGIGIPHAMLRAIFELFSQVHPGRDRAQSGLGIGLSLVRGLVELHGGRVEAKSEGPNQGSEFLVHLPRPKEPGGSSPVTPTTADDSRTQPRRILIADDLIDSANSLAAILRAAGHNVCVAYDGRSALDCATAFCPHIAILDIGMPRLNGHDLARAIRTLPWGKTCTLIAITGWGQATDRELAANAGFDHHLVKPVDVNALQSILDHHTHEEFQTDLSHPERN